MQRLFTRNPSPRQFSRFPLEHPLLPPRSAPTSAPGGLTPRPFRAQRRDLPTLRDLSSFVRKRTVVASEAGYRSDTRAPSIFRATRFGRRVVTHSYADADFHGHRPAVSSEQRLSWYRIGIELGTLTPRSVHPAAPVLLTKSGPLDRRPDPIPRERRLHAPRSVSI